MGSPLDGHTYLERFDYCWECSTKKHDLTLFGVKTEKLFNRRCKFRGEKLVGFVHDKCRAFIKFDNLFSREICYSPRRANNDMNRFVQANDVIFKTSATSGDHDIDTKVLAQGFADL